MSQYFVKFDAAKLNTIEGENDKDYCLRLAIEAKKVGTEVYNSLLDLGISTTSLTSLARVYEVASIDGNNFGMGYDQLKEYIGNKIVT